MRHEPLRSAVAEPADASTSCNLCYRACRLEDGEVGWCGARRNKAGKVVPTEFGVLSSVVRQIRGYGPDPFLTYKPGATSLLLGGLRCSASCSFCMSTNLVHRPDSIPWVAGDPGWRAGSDSWWYGVRGRMDPADAVSAAEQRGCSQILFGINEPTVTAEYTMLTAELARQRGMDVLIETNGFTNTGIITSALAPLVNAVDVGVKGSADPDFYDRIMKSAGAVPHVLSSLLAWRRAGVHLVVGDVIAPPHMQSVSQFRKAAARFYGWIADNLGPLTDVLITQMALPGPLKQRQSPSSALVKPGSSAEYAERLREAEAIARAAGLPYAHGKYEGEQRINCHSCGGTLLWFRQRCGELATQEQWDQYGPCVMAEHFCPWWSHEQHVVRSRCGHCGVEVPIVALNAGELAEARSAVRDASGALTVVSSGSSFQAKVGPVED